VARTRIKRQNGTLQNTSTKQTTLLYNVVYDVLQLPQVTLFYSALSRHITVTSRAGTVTYRDVTRTQHAHMRTRKETERHTEEGIDTRVS